jgi:CPA1 family monovalent cation:H+ antiporter
MRGVVTLAAAQTLPDDTPQRSLLILIAFVVAAGTLVVQGGTLPFLVDRLGLAGDPSAPDPDRESIVTDLAAAGIEALDDPDLRRPDGTTYDPEVVADVRDRLSAPAAPGDPATAQARADQYRELRLVMIHAMREALLRARADGVYDSASLESALLMLDADQITTELRAGRLGGGQE